MVTGLKTEFYQLIFTTFIALIFGLVWGYPVTTLLLAGLFYLLVTYRKVSRLLTWLTSKNGAPPDNIDGFWGELADVIHRDRLKLKRTQVRRLQALQRIKDISMAIRDGIVILDADSQLDWWNRSAEAMLRLKKSDKGVHVLNTLRHPSFRAFLEKGDFDDALIHLSPIGQDTTYEVTASTFGTEAKETVLIFRDISKLKRLERTRKDFIANISHELRTPLTVINGYVDSMETVFEEPKWSKIFDQMRSQSNRITALADDLTMLSKLESDDYTPKMEQVNMQQLLNNVVQDALHLSSAHNITMQPTDETIILSGNYQQLYSACSNLVVNAIRHNPKGCDINVSMRQNDHNLTIEVSDTGKGIAAKHIPRLTERFYRADSDRNSASGGTGLGLAIVKHVLQHHNGYLGIRSIEGRGATFSAIIQHPK